MHGYKSPHEFINYKDIRPYFLLLSKKYFYVIRDRVTADDIIGTKYLPLSEISGNGGTGMLQDHYFQYIIHSQNITPSIVS
jgi:hypothetical protein